jgi:uncharacterized protein YjbI with pentapeptide repeats
MAKTPPSHEAKPYGADLIGVDLREANLSGANLGHAILVSANLMCANLCEAELRYADLRDTNLSAPNLAGLILGGAALREANLVGASLVGANLRRADLGGANLHEADLSGADLSGADLSYANLSWAKLNGANLREATLSRTDLSEAILVDTILGDVDLNETIGLDECYHAGPSIVDFRTLSRSVNLPLSFLRGCGLPDMLSEYLPSLRGEAIQFYSCFISYSHRDKMFAERLHADLQDKGVRCWFAPHDLPIGAKTWDAIDDAIRLRDKLLVVLSKAAISSDWVEDEVSKAYAEEWVRKEVVLLPIRIDNEVMSTAEPWAVKLRDQRNIGDFRQWRRPAGYGRSFEQLLHDLKTPVIK